MSVTIKANQEILLNDYIAPMSRELAEAAIKQFGGWESFLQAHADVCNHGMLAGFSGWIATHEVVEFFAKNQQETMRFAKELAVELGEDSVYEMIQNFACLKEEFGGFYEDQVCDAIHNVNDEHHNEFAQAMGWLVAEQVARSCERMIEDAQEA